MPDCAFDLVSSGELAGEPGDATRITLDLYRITVNEHSRHAAAGSVARPAALGLDLRALTERPMLDPSTRKVRSWRTRSSAPCARGVRHSTSSRKIVPLSDCARSP
jgi:hypothetical protein